MSVNIKVTGGLNIESGHIDPKATQGLSVQMCAEDHAFQFYSNFLNVAVTVASYKKETFCIKHIIERQISPKDQHLPIPH